MPNRAAFNKRSVNFKFEKKREICKNDRKTGPKREKLDRESKDNRRIEAIKVDEERKRYSKQSSFHPGKVGGSEAGVGSLGPKGELRLSLSETRPWENSSHNHH